MSISRVNAKYETQVLLVRGKAVTTVPAKTFKYRIHLLCHGYNDSGLALLLWIYIHRLQSFYYI